MTDLALIERITRSLAFMLRHKPERFDLEVDAHGFAELDEVIRALNERLGEPVEEDEVVDAVEAGDRQRYEIQGSRIRALYGHSIPVEPGPDCQPPEHLYVCVPSRDLSRLRRYGLRGGRRSYLHLALTPDDARESGRRLAREYTLVKVHALDAWEDGVNFYDRKALFLADELPTEMLEVLEGFDDGEEPERRGDRREERGEQRRGRSRRRRGGDRDERDADEPAEERSESAEGGDGEDDREDRGPRRGRSRRRGRGGRAGADRGDDRGDEDREGRGSERETEDRAPRDREEPRPARAEGGEGGRGRDGRDERPARTREDSPREPAARGGDRERSRDRDRDRGRGRRDERGGGSGREERGGGRSRDDDRGRSPERPRPERKAPAAEPAAPSTGFGLGVFDPSSSKKERPAEVRPVEQPAPAPPRAEEPAPEVRRPQEPAEPAHSDSEGDGFGAGL